MANAKFTWIPVGGVLESYTLDANYSYTTKPALRDASDRAQAIDGTMRTYNAPLKQSWLLAFRNITTTQKNQLLAIKEAQVDLNFYQDNLDELTFIAQWIGSFNFIEVAPGTWTGTIQLEEV